MKIVPIVKKGSSCDYHRLILPLRYMGINVEDFEDKTLEENIAEADIVFYSRELPFDISELLILKKKYGFKLVVDIDDYWQLYSNHPLYGMWQHFKNEYKIMLSITNADLIMTTTTTLADKIRPFNPNVHVVPNALPFGREQFVKEEKELSDKLRMVYVGGTSHYWDMKTITSTFEKIARKRFPLEVILGGYVPNGSTFWNKYANIISANGKLDHNLKEGRPLETYMELYDDTDIAIAPLLPNPFNSCKSNLKVIEAGCKGIPIICANVLPYSPEPVLKYDTPNQLYDILKYCSENRNYVRDKGAELEEYVRENFDLIKINNLRKQIFELCLD